MIIANDATVKAGAFFPMTPKKIIRAQHIAMELEIPTVYLVDSAGVFLPLQDEIFLPPKHHTPKVTPERDKITTANVPNKTSNKKTNSDGMTIE